MSLKLSVLLLSLSISIALARRLPQSIKIDTKIQQLRSESMVLAEQHVDTSAMCFTYFSPQLNQITEQYEINYDACITSYELSSKTVENCYTTVRQNIESSALQSCSALRLCNQSANAYTAFDCASTTAAEDAKIFYDISANATDAAAKSKSDYRRIETDRDTCINNAERTYVEDTSLVYGQLNSCLLGNDIPTTSTAGTPTATT